MLRKSFNFNKKEEKKVKNVDLNSQNTQKRLPFPKVLGKHSSKKSVDLPCNQPQVSKNTQTKLPLANINQRMKIQSSLSYH